MSGETFNILLNSSNCINSGQGANQFKFNFKAGGMHIPEGACMSINQVSMPYSFTNVNNYYGNTTMTVYVPTGSSSGTFSSFTITLSAGFYTYSDLNYQLQKALYTNGYYWYSPYLSANSNVISFQGNFPSSSTIQVNQTTSPTVSLAIGMIVQFVNTSGTTTYTTITAQSGTTAGLYTCTTVSSYPSGNVPLTAFVFNENSQSIIYPLTIGNYTPLYSNTIQAYTVPLVASVSTTFGYGYVPANGNFGNNTWSSYPTWTGGCAYIVFPTTTNSTNTLGNLLGFTSPAGASQYPSTNTSLTVLSQTIYGNCLSYSPSFAPLGSNVNAIIVHSDITENSINQDSTILDSFPINTTFGSNITYLPVSDNYIKMRSGQKTSLNISFTDQNNNPIQAQDPNVLISLIIKFPEKKS